MPTKKKAAAPVVQASTRNNKKEIALLESLHEAENHQLTSFIKTRNQELDGDIKRLRDKLKISDVHSIESDKLIASTAATRLSVSGVGLGRVDLDAEAISHGTERVVAKAAATEKVYKLDPSRAKPQVQGTKEQWKIFLARIKLKMEDANMEPEELRDLILPYDLEGHNEYFADLSLITGVLQTDLLMPVTTGDQRILLEKYGNEFGEIDVKQMLSDAGVWSELPNRRKGVPHDGFYPASGKETESNDPTAIRQMHEERAKRKNQEYDTLLMGGAAPSRGDGLTASVLDHTRPTPGTTAATTSGAASKFSASTSAATGASPAHSQQQLPTTKADLSQSKHWDVMHQSSRNIDELNELHALIDEETGNQLGKHSGANRDTLLEEVMEMSDAADVARLNSGTSSGSGAGRTTVPSAGAAAAASPLRKGSDILQRDTKKDSASAGGLKSIPESASSRMVSEGLASDEAEGANRPLTAVERENLLLRREIASFDEEFWEQLEDLKHRYSRLQEIVGESPGIPPDLESSSQYRPHDHSTRGVLMSTVKEDSQEYLDSVSQGRGSLPLDKLAWSVRNSMTAMDRAGLTSPLVARPRGVTAHTYAPGASKGVGASITPSGIAAKYSTYGGGFDSLFEGSATAGSTSQHPHPMSLHHTTGSTRMGGIQDIGTGTHSILPSDGRLGDITGAGTYSNLCERRLAFELTNHPHPEQATNALIHRVMDVASRKGQEGFITCSQLSDVINSVNLNISPKEVEVLAYGLASNAKGGIDATEFCEVVKTMLYNMIGEHQARVAESRMLMKEKNIASEEEDLYDRLLVELCEGILLHDKRAVLGTSPNIYKTLSRPFLEIDTSNSGLIDFESFAMILKDMGSLLTFQDTSVLAYRHMELDADGAPLNARPTSAAPHMDHLQSFRQKKLNGSLRGAAKVKPSFGEFLSNSGILMDEMDEENARMLIRYEPFIRDLETMLEIMMDKQGGVVLGTGKYPWILQEYEFVDALICQLEAMKPSQRRRTLISFQYALSAADPKQECEVDGFTVLNSLITAGFQLQRANRVRLLTAIESMGGKIDYRDLTQVLLASCADWTNEEKSVVKKILKAMGVTVIDRRSWLARLRQLLLESSAKLARKNGDWMTMTMASARESSKGIPPAAFLHCLRDCNVVLNVEEEATLLDCLDTERLSKLGQVEVQTAGASSRSLIAGKDNWSVPLIEYETFLNFCARHCGSWIDGTPEINAMLQETIENIASPVLAVHEFASLIHAFDETNSGTISERAFQICCHRSRLLANLSDEAINDLSDVLVMDGGGKVAYTPFIVHLRALTSQLNAQNSHAATIIEQLIKNATDNKGTLLPLRNWLIKNTDLESCILTSKDMNHLLREFSVLYRPDDLENLQMDIGRHVDASASTGSSKVHKVDYDDATLSLAGGGKSATSKKHVIDSRDLMAHILKTRSHWTSLHPHLCRKMLKCLRQAGDDYYAANDIMSTSHELTAKKPPRTTVKGSETAIARRILSRLKAFASDPSIDGDYQPEEIRKHPMVEKAIFAQLVRVTGISLTDEDVLILADATDCLPEASRVRCDVLLDVLTVAQDSAAYRKINEEGEFDFTTHGTQSTSAVEMTEAGIFALNHLRDLLWSNARSLQRTPLEWDADVRTVIRGFDSTESGFITVEDFVIALQLLNSTMSNELLLDIPYVPQGPGLIRYKELLDFVLSPPAVGEGKHGHLHGTSGTHSHNSHQRSLGGSTKGGASSASSPRYEASAESKRKLSLKKKILDKESPVKLLLNVVRRSIDHFIVTDSSMEEAWICLLRVFQRFDPQETNKVTPRDFCLAISVLIEGDDVVLTKAEWAEIIEHFKAPDEKDAEGRTRSKAGSTGGFYDNTMVNYMIFCETVLDPNEIKHRQLELRNQPYGSSSGTFGGSHGGFRDATTTLDRAKHHLSTSTHSHHQNKERLMERTHTTRSGVPDRDYHSPRGAASGSRGGRNYDDRSISSSSRRPSSAAELRVQYPGNTGKGATRYTHQGFDGTLTGTHFGTAERRQSGGYDPHSASTYSRHSNHAYGEDTTRRGSSMSPSKGRAKYTAMDKENQEIVSRFEELSNRTQYRAQHGYGSLNKPPKDRSTTSEVASAHRRALDMKLSKHRGNHGATMDDGALYRVAQTQGQHSRDIARGQSKHATDSYTLHNNTAYNARRQSAATTSSGYSGASPRDEYAASHRMRGTNPAARFQNWTNNRDEE